MSEIETSFSDWIKAGRITASALDYGASLVKIGVSASFILESIEKKILDSGAEIGFPAQMSVNEIAAHYCAYQGNDIILAKGDVVKLDIGASVNGAIGDTARTISLSDDDDLLLEASKEALKKAISIVRPGVTLSEIGRAINSEISKRGYSPIKNLSGHGISRYNIHTDPAIPNYDNGSKIILHENQIIAIEPFATSGTGFIKEQGEPGVFMIGVPKPQRNMNARRILNYISKYKNLPFAKRWLQKEFKDSEIKIGLSFLLRDKSIVAYPPLVDIDKKKVAQFEHTMIVTKDGAKVTTLLE